MTFSNLVSESHLEQLSRSLEIRTLRYLLGWWCESTTSRSTKWVATTIGRVAVLVLRGLWSKKGC